jgi:dTDP-4-dehydrorhamnose 3,5-epimerase
MVIEKTSLEGVYIIQNKSFRDDRGIFVKTFHNDIFRKSGLESSFMESFYSVSKKNVIRGMHFQTPPYDHNKLVYVVDGKVLDVAVDIRKNSKTYGKYFSLILSGDNCKALYLQQGFAHGYLTLSQSATMLYMTSSVHDKDHDTGIKWDSFGFDWNVKSPIISDRDRDLANLNELYSL